MPDDVQPPLEPRDDAMDEDETPAVPPVQPSLTGLERLRSALRRPGRSQAVVAVLLGVMGFGAVTQVQTNQADDSYTGYREQDLIDVLSGLAGTTRRAQDEVDRLEAARRQLESDTNAQRTAVEQARTESETLAVLAGLAKVSGPGVRITVTEDTGRVKASTFYDMIQELRNAGAEAMQVNGSVRVVAQTSVTDATGGLSIDGKTLTSPFVVDVIGDPSALSGAISFRDGPRSDLQADGATVDVQEQTSLEIDTVRQAAQPEFAAPDDAP
ncbi:DUF881 domain-containing protein [Nocardioides sp. TRM66260-LWL]|uniref:DUF881 domain-containing protein n=1 Tax=Nocardioides sp. TRM66260-LWL TaxID=2874478 RepID=UPI001CC40E85|nr:DUF881 domain-containing protein [Nocardioides sp. TRM66260-LWL]MBZ5734039.1 DUF881 domain-containing protein [Nocardioides sp. TRM66260-LWL]